MSKNYHKMSEEMGEAVFKQTMDIWILPEIKRRQDLGLLPKPTELYAAQIIFFPNQKKPLVRINNEIKTIAMVKIKENIEIKAGDPIYENQLESIEYFKLTDHDSRDCGHITMKKLKNAWVFMFDFRYNKALSQKHIDAANSFYLVAKYAYKKGYIAPFIDNLFSAGELAAKSILLIIPYKNLTKKVSHDYIKTLFNRNAKLKNVKIEHKEVFNELWDLRRDARYLRNEIIINEQKAKEMMKRIKEMIKFAQSRINIDF